jgi:hypothetical protein
MQFEHYYKPFFFWKWIGLDMSVVRILMRFIMCLYCCVLECINVSWTAGASRPYLDDLVSENPILPVFQEPMELLEFTVNNIDYMDILSSNAGIFRIQTTFLDAYRLRIPGAITHGATILLKLVPGDTFRIISITYQNVEYGREDVPVDIICGVLWGILTYVTVGTNLYHLHHQAGMAQTTISNRILPMTHVLRQILLPTELTMDVSPLLTRLSHCFPYTYNNGGLDALIHDYVPWDPLDSTDQRTHLMTMDIPVIGDYRRWWIYTLGHMKHVVAALYPSAEDLKQDIVASRWIRESTLGLHTNDLERLPVLLALAYLGQVRKNFLSNETVHHIIRWYYILHPGPVSVSQASMMMLIMGNTQIHRIRRGSIDHIRVRRVMDNFYNGLGITGFFANSIKHPLAHPGTVS